MCAFSCPQVAHYGSSLLGSFHCVSSTSFLLLAFDLSFMFKAFLLWPATPGCLLPLQGRALRSRRTASWCPRQICPSVGSGLSVKEPSNDSVFGTFLLGRPVSPVSLPSPWGTWSWLGPSMYRLYGPGASLSLFTCQGGGRAITWLQERGGAWGTFCHSARLQMFRTPSSDAPGASSSRPFNSAPFLQVLTLQVWVPTLSGLLS